MEADKMSKFEQVLDSMNAKMDVRSDSWPISHLLWTLLFLGIMMTLNRKKLKPSIPEGLPLG